MGPVLILTIIVLMLAVIVVVICGSIQGLRAMSLARKLRDQLSSHDLALSDTRRRIDALESGSPIERPDSDVPTAAVVQEPRTPAVPPEPAPPPTPVEPPAAAAALSYAELTERLHRAVGRPKPPPPPAPKEEPAPPERDRWASFEQAVGQKWMTWAGALVLFFSACFFVKYAFDHSWLRPGARVALGITFGNVLLFAGHQAIRRGLRALGQGLVGGGLAILYLSLYAGFAWYDGLIPQPMAFGLMVVVSAVGMTMAVAHDAVAVSFLAVLGGFLTPVMMSTGSNARDVLFTYVALLDLSVLGVALFKRWKALDLLAFVGTWLLFTGWFFSYYHRSPAMLPTCVWVGAFYVIFLLMPFVYHLRHRAAMTVYQFIMSLVHGSVCFAYFYRVLHPEHTVALAYLTLGMSACYTTMGARFRTSAAVDQRATLGFIGLAVVFLTLAVPIRFKLYGITLAWALEGPALLWLGYHYRYRPVRYAGFVVLVLAVLRVFARHWPIHSAAFTLFANAGFASTMCVAAAAGAFALVHHYCRDEATPSDRVLKVTAGLGAGFLGLIFLGAEVALWLHYLGREDWSRGSFVALWALGAGGFMAAGLRLRSQATRVAGLVALVIAVLSAALMHTGIGRGDYLVLFSPRFLSVAVVIAVQFGVSYWLRRCRDRCSQQEDSLVAWLAVAAGFMVLLALSWESYGYCRAAVADAIGSKTLARSVVSVLWIVGSVAFLAVGMRSGSTLSRVAGLIAVAATLGLAMNLHAVGVRGPYWLFLSPRFLIEALVVAALWGFAYVLGRSGPVCSAAERGLAPMLYVAGVVMLFLALTSEMYSFWMDTVTPRHRARWIARMSVTILWALYASATLAAGFWRRIRPLRLAALGLFAFTALKLVIVDMAGVEQIYRILAFLVVGVLMIAASYAYHVLEQKLDASGT